jgi:hypothetical protein
MIDPFVTTFKLMVHQIQSVEFKFKSVKLSGPWRTIAEMVIGNMS